MRKQTAIFIVLLPLVIFGLAYVATQTLFPQQSQPALAVTPNKQNQESFLYKLPSLIVNLSGSDGKRYLKIEIFLEYQTEEPEKVKELFNAKKVQLTDTLIMLLSNKTVAAIDGYANKEILKEEIRQKLSGILLADRKIGAITGVYYNTFLVQ